MAYPSNEVPSDGSSVAQGQIKAFVDRILRLKGEVREINVDIREIYAEAKGNGFDKTVLGQVVAYVEKRQSDPDLIAERSALFELYLGAIDGVGTVPATHRHEEKSSLTYGEHLDPALTGAISKQKVSQPLNQAGQTDAVAGSDTSPVESEAVEISTAIAEPQSAPQAGSDLATPPANDDGQVADIHQPDAGDAQFRDPLDWEDEDGAQPVPPVLIVPVKYAAPGLITWEASPPQGVIRHDYSQAFGEAGQDIAVIEDDMANARSAPIVKIGNVILDGWARFMKARSLGIEYPVVQYDGSDSLTDCIKWNTAGRMLTEEQSFRIAQRLAKAEPKRKADIYAAFELGMVLA